MLITNAARRYLSQDPNQVRALLQGVLCISNHCTLNPETCTVQAYLRLVAHEPDVWHRTLVATSAGYADHLNALAALLSALEQEPGEADGFPSAQLLQQCKQVLAAPIIQEHQPGDLIIEQQHEGDDDVLTVPFSILDMKNAISSTGNRSSFYKLAKHHAMRHGQGDDWPLMDYFAYVADDPEGWIVRDRPASQSGESTIRRLIQMMRYALDFAARQCTNNQEHQRVIARCRDAINGLPDVPAIAAGVTETERHQPHQPDEAAMVVEEEQPQPQQQELVVVREPPATEVSKPSNHATCFDAALGQLVFAMETHLAQVKAGGLPPAQAIRLCESMQHISQSLVCIFHNIEHLRTV